MQNPNERSTAIERLAEVADRFSDEYNGVLRDLRRQGQIEIHDMLIQRLDGPIRDLVDASIDVGGDYRQALQQVTDAVDLARQIQDDMKVSIPRAFNDGRMTERSANLSVIKRLQNALSDAVQRIREWEQWANGQSA